MKSSEDSAMKPAINSKDHMLFLAGVCPSEKSLGFCCFVSVCLVILFSLGCQFTEQSNTLDVSSQENQSITQSVEDKGVSLSVVIRPKTPKLSELVELTISITHPGSTVVESPVFGQSVGDFAVRDYSERTSKGESETSNSTDGSISSDESLSTRVIRYKLEPMFSGKHLIRSIPIVLVTKTDLGEEVRDIIQSEPIEIDVVSEFGEVKSDLSQIDPMLDPIAPGQNTIWIAIAGFTALVFLALLAAWYFKRRKREQVIAPELSPEQRAKIALEELMAEELPARGMVKEFYLRLTGIVRVFIEGKTGLRAPEQTTEEFLRDVHASSRFDEQQAQRLREFLTAADLVKYAGQTPDDLSIRQSVERAQEFIEIRFDENNNTLSEPPFKGERNG